MSLVKRNGGALSSFPTVFDDFFNRDLFDWRLSNYAGTGASLPAVNIRETNDAFEVEMAAPGQLVLGRAGRERERRRRAEQAAPSRRLQPPVPQAADPPRAAPVPAARP